MIDYSTSGMLTLNGRSDPSLSVSFPSISAELEAFLKEYGVSQVGNFFCDDVPLFQVSFHSEYSLKSFLRSRQNIQREMANLISAELVSKSPTPSCPTKSSPCTCMHGVRN